MTITKMIPTKMQPVTPGAALLVATIAAWTGATALNDARTLHPAVFYLACIAITSGTITWPLACAGLMVGTQGKNRGAALWSSTMAVASVCALTAAPVAVLTNTTPAWLQYTLWGTTPLSFATLMLATIVTAIELTDGRTKRTPTTTVQAHKGPRGLPTALIAAATGLTAAATAYTIYRKHQTATKE